MFSKIANAVSKLFLGGCTLLLTACYAPPTVYPAMYAPYDPPVDLKRSISGYVKDKDKNAVAAANVVASHEFPGSGRIQEDKCYHYAITSKDGFYYVELVCLPASEKLEEDQVITLKVEKNGFEAKTGEVLFTKMNQEEHIELDVELTAKPNNNGANGEE